MPGNGNYLFEIQLPNLQLKHIHSQLNTNDDLPNRKSSFVNRKY